MARKKKKQTRKQRIKQRRAKIERIRKRKTVSRNKNVSAAQDPQQEVVDDMLPLFPLLADGAPSPADMQQIMMVVLDSADLADEPEFEEIIFDPMLSVNTFFEVGQELGLGPDTVESLDELSDEERDDNFLELLEQTGKRLFTEESNQEIISRLNKLRLRLKKRSAKKKKVAKVAALQSFLSEQQGDAIWPMVGLIQALVHRSVGAGFELVTTTAEFAGSAGIEELDSISSMSEKLEQSGLGKKAISLIKRIPGMRSFLENQVDQMWEEGAEAVFAGNLHLALYTEEEIEAGAEIMRTIFGDESDEESDIEDEEETKLTEENVQTLVVRLDEFVTALFTQDRLEQLRERLREIVKNSEVPKEWTPFILMLQEYMADENAAEYEKGFLIRALMGEIRMTMEKYAEEAGETEL